LATARPIQQPQSNIISGGEIVGSVKKWRRKKIAKHKHRKMLKLTRFQRK
jgi:hypothetical protein